MVAAMADIEQTANGRHLGLSVPRIWASAKETLTLAAPVMVARALMPFLFTVDMMLVGHYASEQVGLMSLGLAPQSIMLLGGIGIMQGVTILISQAIGAQEFKKCGPIFRSGIGLAMMIGVLFVLVSLSVETFYVLIGQPADHAAFAGTISIIFAFSAIPSLIFVSASYFMEASGRPRVGMWIMIAANVINLAVAWPLVFGVPGLVPDLGAYGAALANTIVRLFMCGAMLWMIWRTVDKVKYGLEEGLWPKPGHIKHVLNLGFPLSLTMAGEVVVYRTLAVSLSYLGLLQITAYEVSNNVMGLVFMIAVGMSAATSIRVGKAVGANDPAAVKEAGWTGIGLIGFVMAIPSAIIWLFPDWIAIAFLEDETARELTAVTLVAMAFCLIVDCMAGVMMGALRGLGDTSTIPKIQLSVLWFICLPIALFMAFQLELGPPGAFYGLAIGLVVSAAALGWRFYVVSNRPLARA